MINWTLMVQISMGIASFGYAMCAISYFMAGKPWMASTFLLYFLTIITLYLEGSK